MTTERTPNRTLATYLAFVKFEHTLFALPFAYAGMTIAAQGWPGIATFTWITLAMVGARTAAMAINRVVDADIDAANPRTADRDIPVGRLQRRDGLILAVLAVTLLIVSGVALNPLTATLLPVALVFLVAYPWTKRFTWACHLWLGVTIGAAAAGGSIAVTGTFDVAAILLWIAVGTWIAGFDVIYALLDHAFDVAHGVHSIPARFGVRRAIDVSAGLHLVSVAAMLALPAVTPLGLPYLLIVAGTVLPLLVMQQVLVRRRGVTAALTAFNANLWISALVLLAVVLDVALPIGLRW